MRQDINFPALLKTKHRTTAFEELLALGAMLATLTVVALGYLLSDDGSVRARFVLTGFEMTLFTLVAGLIASALHTIIVRHKELRSFSECTSAKI